MKKPNRFSIKAEDRKKQILHFLKNIWIARYTFMKIYGVDPEIVMADQMPLHKKESPQHRILYLSLNKGAGN